MPAQHRADSGPSGRASVPHSTLHDRAGSDRPQRSASPAARHDARVIRDRAAFAAFRDEWTRSSVDDPRAHQSIFGSHEWFDAALEWFPEDAALEILCHVPPARPATILPLARRRVSLRGVDFRELAFIAVPDTAWCDAIGREADSDAACEALVDMLMQLEPWDVMRLDKLAVDSVVATRLARCLARRGFIVTSAVTTRNPCVSLTGTWSAYLASRSRSFKKALNLANNRLGKVGEIEIARIDADASEASIDARLADAITVSAASWKRDTGNTLDRPGPQAFIRRLSAHARARRWLSLWTLAIDGRPLATEYQLIANGIVYALRSDFDPAFEEASPGTHLNRTMLERLFDAGLVRYSMGPGENPYKLRWSDGDEAVVSLVVYGKTLRGRALAVVDRTIRPWVARMRDGWPGSSA